jgi:hypothetical protein
MNKRRNNLFFAAVILLLLVFPLQGCGTKFGSSANDGGTGVSTAEPAGTDEMDSTEPGTNEQADNNTGTQTDPSQTDPSQSTPPAVDLNAVKPNEAGRIMVVMFHNFVEEYKSGDKAYTTTFDAFGKLLDRLYASDYRLISLSDYLNGTIDTPAGCIPMVFTFDDGTAGQFNLIDENGALTVNPRSAVGILEEFNKAHPDFGTKGTFFVNLGDQTFNGGGTVAQRLEYLIGRGFEIGNHTYTHINLKETKSADKIQQEIGENQKKMLELIPGYVFNAFSLPYGAPAKDLKQYVLKGEFEGVKYENHAIMEVGWDPAASPFGVKFDPLSVHRVRSSGITPVDADLGWWLDNMKRDNQYVSDGDPSTVTVPESYAEYVDPARLGSQTLVKY